MTRDDIDKKIGMPDVDAEWKKFEQENRSLFAGNSRDFSLRKIAAIFVAALMLTGLSYAAVRTSFFTQPWNGTTAEDHTAVSPSSPLSETEAVSSATPEMTLVGDSVILFKDVRLDSILMQIDPYYKVESRLTDNELRKIRLLFKWQKQHSLDEVLQRLNGFERFQIRREENTLIVEQPQAEQQSR